MLDACEINVHYNVKWEAKWFMYSKFQCQSTQSVLMLSDGGTNSPKCESESILVVPNLMKTQMCLDAHPKCQNHTSLKVDVMDIYATSIPDADIEKGKLETTKSNDEAVGNVKAEDSLTVSFIPVYYSLFL